jgi:hydrocephalus-inducing protein
MEFDIVCNADDSSKFNDILHFVVKDGKDKDIALKARGIGSTIYCDDNLEALNYGTIYTYKTAVKEIFIQNRGRKSQKISWQRKKALEKKKKEEEKTEDETVFSIDPETETIPPKYGRYFRFVAMSQKKGKITEEFNLLSQVGNERQANQLKAMLIEGEFTQPNLIYSEKKIHFKYVWEKNVPTLPLEKVLELTSGSTLPLDFHLKVSPPFSVSEENHYL